METQNNNMSKEKEFKNRVYGCAIIKSINSNYNADFTHQPRTLPDGIVYATDKALKWSVKNYLIKNYPNEKIFFWKRLNEEMNPLTLDETFKLLFGEFSKKNKSTKGEESKEVIKIDLLKKLLNCIDIRFFGATYAGIVNISIHGPVQINHGVNRFPKNEIYSEQIMSPFRNPGKESESDKAMTTLGSQSKLREGHYVHHFSINPLNLTSLYDLVEKAIDQKNNITKLSEDDISKLKEAFRYGATYYDSASKSGTENELLLWIELKENEKLVLPNFTEYISITRNKDGKVEIDFNKVTEILKSVNDKLSKIELYYDKKNSIISGLNNNDFVDENNSKLFIFDLI